MNAMEIIIGIVVILASLAAIVLVLLQQGRRAGINSAIGGGAESFLSKSKSRSIDATLKRLTKVLLVVFMLILVAVNAYNLLR